MALGRSAGDPRARRVPPPKPSNVERARREEVLVAWRMSGVARALADLGLTEGVVKEHVLPRLVTLLEGECRWDDDAGVDQCATCGCAFFCRCAR